MNARHLWENLSTPIPLRDGEYSDSARSNAFELSEIDVSLLLEDILADRPMEPVSDRWPRLYGVLFAVASSALLWGAIIVLFRFVLA